MGGAMSTPIGAIAMPAVERWHDDGMPTHIALLRGINVGGRNRVAS